MSAALALLLAGPAQPSPEPPVLPRQMIAGYISDADYPAAAIRSEAQGTSVVDLDISPSGEVTGCTVVRSAGHPALDETTCAVLTQRMRFDPVRRGARAETRHQMRITWRLPPPAPAAIPACPDDARACIRQAR